MTAFSSTPGRPRLRSGCLALGAGILCGLVWASSFTASGAPGTTTNNFIRGEHYELNDNGAWSWFMDERAIVDHNRLIVGSVRANGEFTDSTRRGWGNVELSILDLGSKRKDLVVLSPRFEQDDHDSPGLLVLGDGHYLAAYSKHGQETRMYYRISLRKGNPYEWGPVQIFDTPGTGGDFHGSSFTYCNPIRLTGEHGRIYMLHRGVGLDPNYLISEDDGRTWQYGGRLFLGKGGYSPYAKYTSNGRDTIHIVATEDHPRNFDNSLYHAFLRGGTLYLSDGRPIGPLPTSSNTTLHAWELTRLFHGSPTNVAWMSDIQLDEREQPVVLFTTQRDGAGLPVGAGGMDHRFNYAHWNGSAWEVHEIAYAGTRLYAGEDDYTGLGSIDPQDTWVVYLSTDADPVTGKPLMSKANFRRNHELFRGVTSDEGRTWRWASITSNSSEDNLRPIVPVWKDRRTAVIWMRGAYRVNRGEWSTKVIVTLLQPSDFEP
jgi:hypothetical protein